MSSISAASRLRADVLRRAFVGLLAAAAALVALHDWLGVAPGLDAEIGEGLYCAVILGAGLACIARAFSYRQERGAWLLIGAAIVSWGTGEIFWFAVIEGNEAAPYPSLADAGYLLYYPLAYAGLAMLVRARAHELNWRLWMDGAIAALGTAALGAAFVYDFVADRATGTPVEMATTLAYPLGDIAMVSVVVVVLTLTGWRPGRTWSLLLAGLTVLVVADVAYTLAEYQAAAIPGGEWTDPLYAIAAVLFAATVWRPAAASEITARVEDPRREIVVPAVFAAVMIGLFTMQYFSAKTGLSTILWAGTMTAVIVRLAVSDRENKALLEEVRTDALTGLGNRGRLQVELPPLFAGASAEEPLLVMLADLNGFKHYNDTFGHPAGDEILARLGAALLDTLGEDGSAYRIGGDEFCIVLRCPAERFEQMTRRVASALTATGPGFNVSPSLGVVEVPREESDRSAALQLADVRMYAQKESRRSARDAGYARPEQVPEAEPLGREPSPS
jgi:two-component system, cell cycle response regulator